MDGLIQKYRENAERYNVVLLGVLILLNLFDIILTIYGVNYLMAFSEGNTCLKDSINAGNFIPALIYKGAFVGVVWLGVFFRKGKQHIVYSSIITAFLIFDILFYSLIVMEWFLKILSFQLF